MSGAAVSLGVAAARWAAAGFPVFPLFEPDPRAPRGSREDGTPTGGCSCQEADCEHAGKHPRTGRGGLHHATTDGGQVGYWWRRWPGAGIGLRTGCALSGGGFLAVLDVDPRNNGDASLEELEASRGALPRTQTVRTGGGGWHYYFSTSEPLPSRKGLREGLDLKATAGYVVAPPSPHPSGRYVVETRTRIEPAPPWLLTLAAERSSLGPSHSLPEKVRRGRRDDTLTSLAGTLRRRGLVAEEILPCLEKVNELRCDPPLPDKELERIARSVERYPAGDFLRPTASLVGTVRPCGPATRLTVRPAEDAAGSGGHR